MIVPVQYATKRPRPSSAKAVQDAGIAICARVILARSSISESLEIARRDSTDAAAEQSDRKQKQASTRSFDIAAHMRVVSHALCLVLVPIAAISEPCNATRLVTRSPPNGSAQKIDGCAADIPVAKSARYGLPYRNSKLGQSGTGMVNNEKKTSEYRYGARRRFGQVQ